MMFLKRAVLAAPVLALALHAAAFAETAAPTTPAATATPPAFDLGMIPAPHISLPKGASKAMVVLLSDTGGWTAADEARAAVLAEKGAFVIGIDLPPYFANMEKEVAEDDDCIYLVSDIESLSQQVQRSVGGSIYHLPIVAGLGGGGALALAIAAQTPDATIQHTIAVDPQAGIPLKKPLCTPATRTTGGTLSVYGLTDGDLPDPITASFTADAPADGRAHVEDLRKEHDDIEIADSDDDPATALGGAIDAVIDTPVSDTLGLPLSVLETEPTRDTMAIIYSGDGGWRDLDKQIGQAFQDDGMPTIGVDSLRYFWSARTPAETSADLAKIVDLYSKRWGVQHVLLVGYSFGADILPTAYNLLPPAEKAKVSQISLLALSNSANFQISVMGWLGVDGDANAQNAAQLARIDAKLVQCFYGTEDDDSLCPTLKPSGAELFGIDGGHHFDGDYAALATKILAGIDARRKSGAVKP